MKKDLLTYGLGAVLLKFISLFLIPVYASHFSTADYGVLTFLQLFATILEWFFGLQIFSGMWRYYYELDGENQTKLVKSSFGFSAIINFTILIFTIMIIQFPMIKNLGYNHLLMIVLVTSFVSYFANQGVSILRLQRKATTFLKLNVSRAFLYSLLVILFVVVFQQGIVSVFYGQLIAGIFLFVIFFFFMGNFKYLSFSFDKEFTKKMLTFSIPLIPGCLAMWVLNSSDIFFIKYFYTISDVGTYAFSYKILTLIQILLVIPLKQAWTPFIFSKIKDKEFIKKKINQMLQLFFAASFIFVIFLSFFTKDILSLFAKEGYLEGTKIIFVAGLSYIMYGGCMLMAIGYHIAEKTKLLPKYFAYGAITNIVLNYFFIKWFGLMGAAIATFLSFFLIFLLYNLNINKYFPLKISYKVLAFISMAGFVMYFSQLLVVLILKNNFITLLIKTFLLFSYVVFISKLLRNYNIIDNEIKSLFTSITNRIVVIENIYLLHRSKKFSNLQMIDNKFHIRIINKEDIEKLRNYSLYRKENYFEEHLVPRMNDNRWVGLATIDKKNNEIAYLSWIATKNVEFINKMKIVLNEKQFFMKDGHCVPKYRHQGIHQRMMQERINYCISNGANEIFVGILNSNKKGIDNVQGFGFKLYKRIFLIKPFNRLIVF